MLVAIQAKLRGGALYRFRLDMGISQKRAAELAGVTHQDWWAAECLRFDRTSASALRKMANLVGVDVLELCPEELRDQNAAITRIAFGEATANLLAAKEAAERLCLPSPAECAEQHELAEIIDRALAALPFRAREIVTRRFGLAGQKPQTLEQIAKATNITRERVRQIEARAVRALQRPGGPLQDWASAPRKGD